MADDAPDADRALVLDRVRRALNRPQAGDDPVGARASGDRVAHPRANTIPMRAQLQQPQLGELFDEMVRASGATLAHVDDLDAVPAEVARWCAEQALPGAAVVAPASPLAGLDWSSSEVELEQRLVRSGDPVALATAALGMAETGTLVMTSGPENPVTGNFLPDAQVVVLRARDLVGTPEDVWAALRERGALPRTVNWITGPSRTGDIEMVMEMGAHGPIRLHVIVVDA